MRLTPSRLAVVFLGDRLAVAALDGARLEAFTVDAENPSEALRAELDARRLSAYNAFLGLSRGLVTVKPIDLPPVPGDLRQMVGFELERHLPFPADDAYYDFVALPAEAGAERAAAGATEQRVLITAVDGRVVDTALRVAQEARLRPLSLTVASHNLPALARMPRRAHVAWVHRAGATTDVLLLAGDALVLSRSLPGTDDALVTEEVRRSLIALRWRALDAVWVSGDADSPGTLAALGAPVTAPAWTSRAEDQLEALPAEERGVLTLALAVAAGRTVRPLELLPSAMRPRRLTRAQAVTLAMAVLTAVLGIVALLAPGWREYRHLARIDAEIARLDPDVKAVDRVLRDLERKRKLLAMVDGVETAAVRPLPVLRDLTELLPTDAWLTTVSLDSKGLEVTGAASAASTLIPLLENSPRFERVEFSSPVTRGRDSKEQFRIRAAWEPGGAVVPAAAPPGGPGPTPPAGAPASRPAAGAVTPAPPAAPGTPPAASSPPRRPAPTLPPAGGR